MKLYKLFVYLALLLSSSLQAAQVHLCARLLAQVRRQLVSTHAGPDFALAYLKQKYGVGAYQQMGVESFENDVLDVYAALLDPELRQIYTWEWLTKKWELKDSDVLLLRTYYSLQIFDDHPELTGHKAIEMAFLESLRRRNELKHNPEFRERVFFYQARLGKLSVPEIAREQGLSEAQVRREIFDLGLSIKEAFEGDWGEGSTQAQEFIRHHLGLEPRGEAWTRVLSVEGHPPILEADLLVFLKEEGRNHQQIADTLNKALVVEGAENHFRSAQAVSQKLRDLGYAESRQMGQPLIEMEPYGKVKEFGALRPAALEYLWDHRKEDIKELAATLEISPSALRDFLKRHHLLSFFENSESSTRGFDVEDLKGHLHTLRVRHENEKLKQDFAHSFLDEIARTGKVPSKNNSYWKERSPVSYNKAWYPSSGTNSLYPNRLEGLRAIEAEHLATRSDYSEADRKKIEQALKMGIALAHYASFSLEKQKRQFHLSYLDEISGSGVIPSQSDPYWQERSPVGYLKAWHPKRGGNSLYPNRLEGLRAIEAEYLAAPSRYSEAERNNIEQALEKGIASARFSSLPLEDLQRQFHLSYLDELAATGKIPSNKDPYWKERSPVSYSKAWNPGKSFDALYPNRLEGLRAIQAEYLAASSLYSEAERKNIEQALEKGIASASQR